MADFLTCQVSRSTSCLYFREK